MKNDFLIDVGSSTTKVYEEVNKVLKSISSTSIKFKDGFSEELGITDENKCKLITLLKEIRGQDEGSKIKAFATGLFRKINQRSKQKLVDDIFLQTGTLLNIISQELESFYLQKALIGKYHTNENLLLINIGGSSTELVVVKNGMPIEVANLDLGVGSILAKFPLINSQISEVHKESVVLDIYESLPYLKEISKIGFYSGGELTYMQLVKYELKENNLFTDLDHPFILPTDLFYQKNDEVFTEITLHDLEKLMPGNPAWMHGARACSAIAEAICRKYNIELIIPSNSNLIDGVARQEFRKVTISGSFRKHLKEILEVRKVLTDSGVEILSPRFTEPNNPGEEFVVFQGEEGLSPLELERHHLESINESDALIVVDPDGYVGASALIEIGYANKLGKKVVFVNKPQEFMLNTLPFELI